ncbi:MAG: corrinoid protein [Fidelibacterota bacterium]|nr:MAG: corrinoid protein [Candidatus Neomarinimicrobiota bacterium]
MAGKPGVVELIETALSKHLEVGKILQQGLIAGMEVVGDKFSNGEYFLPDLLMSAQAVKAGMQLIDPLLRGEDSRKLGVIVIGTVRGDMHDIGKNLVAVVLEGGGFDVIDLGIDVSPETFLEQGREHPEAVIGMSALLTTTRESIRTTVDILREADLKNKIIVGGAVVNQEFADEIGADGYSRDATKAVHLVKDLLGITA